MKNISAAELRKRIIDVCAANGGHIGASLGAIEITIALHSEFETPKDSIVWDIGHQSYAHKILTDREEQFSRLRKKTGPSGFTCRAESIHDVFGAGHSSTSISAALGIAEAKRIKNDVSWTIAVIGDGALTSGLAFEALNQAGASEASKLVLIINDNNFSISPNVGALDRYVFGTEREPRLFFESLGFHYVGPFDGHDTEKMREELRKVKAKPNQKVSVLHVITKKGKGYEPAEREPVRFHGVGPFDKITGKSEAKPAGQTYSQVFGSTLEQLAQKDPSVVVITPAMIEGSGLAGFAKNHPDRIYDVGIAEPHALVFAAGLATQGLTPIVAIYSTFLQRAIDSVIHDIALQNLNVVLGIDRAGLVGADGPTHHGAFDIALLRSIPNTSIAAPSSLEDLQEMLSLAITKPGLKAIRYPRGTAPIRTAKQSKVEWGRASRLQTAKNEGNGHVAIWALGQSVHWINEALTLLSQDERDQISLIDSRFVKPLDENLLSATVKKASALISIEDAVAAAGFGSMIVESLLRQDVLLPKTILTLGLPERFLQHAELSEQREEAGLSAAQLAAKIQKVLQSN